MVILHAQHYLSLYGKRLFAAWVVKASEVLQQAPGFISIQQIWPHEKPNDAQLFLEFDTIENLEAWLKSSDYEQLLAELAPYREKEPETKVWLGKSRLAGQTASLATH